MSNDDHGGALNRRLLDLDEVSNWLRVSRDTVYRLSRAGELPAFKVGGGWRFRAEDVEACLNRWVTERTEDCRQESTPRRHSQQ